MLARITAIAWKDLYITFKDRDALIYMIALPVLLSAIIGLAFGTSGDVQIDAVPVAVINQDQGVTLPDGTSLDLGAEVQRAFVPSSDPAQDTPYRALYDLTDGKVYADFNQARAHVEDGDLAAAIAITDPQWTAQALAGGSPAPITLYYDSGRSIGPSVVRAILSAITNSMNSVILAQQIGPAALAEIGSTLGADEATVAQAVERLRGQAMTLAEASPIRLERLDWQGKRRIFDAMQYFAPSMAILFMSFAMGAGAATIRTEIQQWTLPRILSTPTPRWVFMVGKLLGMVGTGLAQMVLLIAATTLIARLMGREHSVWGNDLAGLTALLLAVVFAAVSLGLLVAALARSAEQASTYSSIVSMVLGMLGGSFIPIENLPDALAWLPKLTLNYWGIRGFFDLATGEETLAGIVPNLAALLAMGIILCAAGLWVFARQQEV